MNIGERIAKIKENISRACERAHRTPDEVQVMAVTKTISPDVIREAVENGITLFGENRVQEARAKSAEGAFHDCTLALIGHLQTNKASMAVRTFDAVHSVDSERVTLSLAKYVRQYQRGRLPVLIEVNAGRDPKKHGCMPEEVRQLVELVISTPELFLEGLMTVAPGYGDLDAARAAFRELSRIRQRLLDEGVPEQHLRHLSMGMSSDYEVAIEEGATIVRLGTALFGERLYK